VSILVGAPSAASFRSLRSCKTAWRASLGAAHKGHSTLIVMPRTRSLPGRPQTSHVCAVVRSSRPRMPSMTRSPPRCVTQRLQSAISGPSSRTCARPSQATAYNLSMVSVYGVCHPSGRRPSKRSLQGARLDLMVATKPLDVPGGRVEKAASGPPSATPIEHAGRGLAGPGAHHLPVQLLVALRPGVRGPSCGCSACRTPESGSVDLDPAASCPHPYRSVTGKVARRSIAAWLMPRIHAVATSASQATPTRRVRS